MAAAVAMKALPTNMEWDVPELEKAYSSGFRSAESRRTSKKTPDESTVESAGMSGQKANPLRSRSKVQAQIALVAIQTATAKGRPVANPSRHSFRGAAGTHELAVTTNVTSSSGVVGHNIALSSRPLEAAPAESHADAAPMSMAPFGLVASSAPHAGTQSEPLNSFRLARRNQRPAEKYTEPSPPPSPMPVVHLSLSPSAGDLHSESEAGGSRRSSLGPIARAVSAQQPSAAERSEWASPSGSFTFAPRPPEKVRSGSKQAPRRPVRQLAVDDSSDAVLHVDGTVHVQEPGNVAVAVAIQSDEEILETFKQAVLAKHGSFEAVFKWLDFTRKGRITKFNWLSGLRIMHVDLSDKVLIRLFTQIDKSHAGAILSSDWSEFFECEDQMARTPSIKSKRLLHKLSDIADKMRKMRATGSAESVEASMGPEVPELPNLALLVAAAEDDESELSPKASAARALLVTDEDTAEAEQIKEDVEELGLSGVRALAYILAAKCGSLDLAFKWLDYNWRHEFSRSAWDTAGMILHIDMEQVTGEKPREIFRQMSADKHHCKVTKAAWDKFFREVANWDVLKDLKVSVQKRARKKLIVDWKWKAPVGTRSACIPRARWGGAINAVRMSSKLASSAETRQEEQAVTSPASERPKSGSGRSKTAAKVFKAVRAASRLKTASRLREGLRTAHDKLLAEEFHSVVGEESSSFKAEKPPESPVAVVPSAPPTQRAAASPRRPRPLAELPATCGKVAIDDARSTASTSVPPSPASSQAMGSTFGSASGSESLTSSMDLSERLASLRAVSAPLRLPGLREMSGRLGSKAHKEPELTPEQELDQFKAHNAKTMKVLMPDEGIHFSSVRRLERLALEAMAKEQGYWYGLDGHGFLVYRIGPKAEKVQDQLQALGPGDCLQVDHMTYTQALFAYTVAIAASLCPSKVCDADGKPYEGEDNKGDITLHIFNLQGSLQNFVIGLRKLLGKVAPGQELALPGSLSKEQARAATEVAESMGLMVGQCTDGDESRSHLVVGHLADFVDHVRKELGVLRQGAGQTFDELSILREQLLKKVVQEDFTGYEVSCLDPQQSQTWTNLRGRALRVQRLVEKPQPIQRAPTTTIAFDEEEDCEFTFCINSSTAQAKIQRLFEMYASGTRGGVKVFLRTPDLKRFMEDAHRMHQWKHRMHQKYRRIHASTNEHLQQFEEEAHDLFEQTLELQEDMGTRILHGITYDYFQVFVGKSANILGWCMPGFLKAMLELRRA
mmetsp:Transcript_22815/g.52169  ORF Transcript_22815/g.52169 Transcript_22815/m.52169 type:complete len:1243 (-) Transcript_22815:283-4011(-)